MEVEQILELKSKLQNYKTTGFQSSYNILKQLQDSNLTTDQLKQTKITQTVKTLSDLQLSDDIEGEDQQNQFKNMVEISKNLIKIWKSLFSKPKQNSQTNLSLPKQPSLQKLPSLQKQNSTTPKIIVRAQIPKSLDLKQIKPLFTTKYRQQPLQKLFGCILATIPKESSSNQQIQNDDDLDFLDSQDDIGEQTITFAMDYAQKAERAIFNLVEARQIKNKNLSMIERNYKILINEICTQLLKNHTLRQNILNQKVTVEQLAQKEPEVYLLESELEELKKIEEREAIANDQHFWTKKKNAFIEKEGAIGEKCRFCHKKTAFMYDERQTRAADEPMTRFMRCNECGKQWRD